MFNQKDFVSKHGYAPVALVFDADWVNGLAMIRGLGQAGVEVFGLSNRPKAIGFYSKYVTRQVIYPDPENEPAAFIDVVLSGR